MDHDIALLLGAARGQQLNLEWELLEDYPRPCHFEEKLAELKSPHARLTKVEKAQLMEAARSKSPRPPSPSALQAEALLKFAAFASSLGKQPTRPVRFDGKHWKL